MSGRGGYAPTDGLAYDPEDPSYWDEAALHRETARVFDVCAACRMCFSCGYDLQGLMNEPDGCLVCPECGAAWNAAD